MSAEPLDGPPRPAAPHITGCGETWARRRRWRSALVIVIWTLTPIYNMVMVALESHGDVFTTDIWPTQPSLASFWIVVTQGYWYLEYFWHQFGNSLYIGVATVFLTLLIGSLASFSIGRMRIRYGWLVSNAALLTYVIPASFLAIPFYRIMHEIRPRRTISGR